METSSDPEQVLKDGSGVLNDQKESHEIKTEVEEEEYYQSTFLGKDQMKSDGTPNNKASPDEENRNGVLDQIKIEPSSPDVENENDIGNGFVLEWTHQMTSGNFLPQDKIGGTDDGKMQNRNTLAHPEDEDGVHMYIFNEVDQNMTFASSNKSIKNSSNRRKRKAMTPKKIKQVVENHAEEKSYTCTTCDERFSNQRDLRMHAKTHVVKTITESELYTCTVCGEEFHSKKKFRLHDRTHQNHVCTICDEKFNMKSKLNKHMRIHTGPKSFNCELCEKVCKRKAELIAHIRIHTGEKPFLCPTCGKGFKFPHHLKGHLLIHTGEKPFVCEFCGRGFNDRSSMRRHTKTHFDIDESVTDDSQMFDESGLGLNGIQRKKRVRRKQIYARTHVCEFCGKAFIKGQHLRVHIRTHTGEKPYQCEECGKQFNDPSSWRRHRKTYAGRPHGVTDEKIKEYKCSICNKEFSYRRNYKAHVRRHSQDKTFECSICGMKFHTKHHLRCHTTMHMVDKPYKCTVCDKRFNNYSMWYCHFRSHKGDKKFQCNICGKFLMTGAHLKSHLQTHSGSHPFSCDICGKTFIHGTAWKSHMKRVHTDTPEYDCMWCDKSFEEEMELKQHMSTAHINNLMNRGQSSDFTNTRNETDGKVSNEKEEMNITVTTDGGHNVLDQTLESLRAPGGENSHKNFMIQEDIRNTDTSSDTASSKNNRLTDDLVNIDAFEEFTSSLSDNFREYIQAYLKDGDKPTEPNTSIGINFRDTYQHDQGRMFDTQLPDNSARSPVKAFACSQCDKSFTERRTLRIHFRLHTGQNLHECNVCGKLFPKRYNYDRHMRIHNPKKGEQSLTPKPYPCSECDKSFCDKGSLNTHLRLHTGINLNECDICGKIFTKRYNFERHYAMHVRKDEKIDLKNGQINNSKNSEFILDNYNLADASSKQFPCTECDKRFSDQKTLNIHFRIHTGIGLQECHICGKKFTKRYNLKQHMLTHPVDAVPNSPKVKPAVKPFPCMHCDKSFSERGTLTTHLRIHTGENLRECDFCGKKFTKNYNYLRHIRMHTGDKPFKCDYCGRGFSDNSSLIRHQTKKHPEMAPLNCPICYLGLFSEASLEKHKMTHEVSQDISTNQVTPNLTDEDTQDYIADFQGAGKSSATNHDVPVNDEPITEVAPANMSQQGNFTFSRNSNGNRTFDKSTHNDTYMVQVKVEPVEPDQEYIF